MASNSDQNLREVAAMESFFASPLKSEGADMKRRLRRSVSDASTAVSYTEVEGTTVGTSTDDAMVLFLASTFKATTSVNDADHVDSQARDSEAEDAVLPLEESLGGRPPWRREAPETLKPFAIDIPRCLPTGQGRARDAPQKFQIGKVTMASMGGATPWRRTLKA